MNRRLRDDFDREWDDHLARLLDDLVDAGWAPSDALLEANRRMGDRDRHRRRALAARSPVRRLTACVAAFAFLAILASRWSPPFDAAPPSAAHAGFFVSSSVEDEISRLNRSGRWADAVASASEALASGELSDAARARVMISAAHACECLHRTEDVRRWMRQVAPLRDELPAGSWYDRRAAELDRESSLNKEPREAESSEFEWTVVDPEEVGVDPEVVERHRSLCQRTGADACLVVRSDRIVSEWTSERYREPVYAMSSTKSVTSLLVGMLIADGRLEGIEQPVADLIPEWKAGVDHDVRIRHLLSHTSGLARRREHGVGSVADKNAYVLSLPLDHAKETAFSYSNEGVQLLSPLLDRAAREPIQAYAARRLFAPLGMTSTRLHLDVRGHAWTYADMETTPRDLARIGRLMLRRGDWDGQRIVPADWVDLSVRQGQPFEPRCGLLWWRFDDPEGFAALGYLDTNVYVFPRLDLVVVRTQARPVEEAVGDYEREALPLFRAMVR